MASYVWTRDDEILALWLYDAFCNQKSNIIDSRQRYIEAAAALCGHKAGSFKVKLQNNAALEKKFFGKISSGFSPLDHFSAENEEVFRAFFTCKSTLKKEAERIIETANSKLILKKNRLKTLLHS